MQRQELGYDAEHNLIINAPMVVDSTINSRIEVFKTQLQHNPNIHAITMTSGHSRKADDSNQHGQKSRGGESPGKRLLSHGISIRIS